MTAVGPWIPGPLAPGGFRDPAGPRRPTLPGARASRPQQTAAASSGASLQSSRVLVSSTYPFSTPRAGTALIPLAAPPARAYDPHIGMARHNPGWIIPRRP
jgi:hypothetical protein